MLGLEIITWSYFHSATEPRHRKRGRFALLVLLPVDQETKSFIFWIHRKCFFRADKVNTLITHYLKLVHTGGESSTLTKNTSWPCTKTHLPISVWVHVALWVKAVAWISSPGARTADLSRAGLVGVVLRLLLRGSQGAQACAEGISLPNAREEVGGGKC